MIRVIIFVNETRHVAGRKILLARLFAQTQRRKPKNDKPLETITLHENEICQNERFQQLSSTLFVLLVVNEKGKGRSRLRL